MTEHIVQKIQHIRSLPEHVRMRYALGAVIVCMIFIIGIWILTIKQGFLRISPEVRSGKEQSQETITNVGNSFPGTDSLRVLQEGKESLRVNSTNNAGTERFIDQELERETNTNPVIPNQAP